MLGWGRQTAAASSTTRPRLYPGRLLAVALDGDQPTHIRIRERGSQGEAESCAGFGGVHEADVAALGADEVAGDGQAEAGAAGFAAGDEGLEQVFPHQFRQAGAVIGDGQDGEIGVGFGGDSDRGGTGFGGVADQVGQRAAQGGAVALDRGCAIDVKKSSKTRYFIILTLLQVHPVASKAFHDALFTIVYTFRAAVHFLISSF